MFKTIFSFETKRWLKSWMFYLFIALFFGLSLLTMASVLGYFDAITNTSASNTYMNSPIAINGIINALATFINFIIPTVIASLVYRDFKYNAHTLLFAYPFNKLQYLLGKFFSGYFIVLLITLFIVIGVYVSTILPFANPDLLGPQQIFAYFQSYLIFIIPNIFFVGAITFMLTTLTRNQYIGFIFVIILLIFQSVLYSLSVIADDKFYYALFDPTGNMALDELTKYWTIAEQNTLNIPFTGVLLYNRLLWIGVGILALVFTYYRFSFSHSVGKINKKKAGNRVVKDNFSTIIKINLPKVSYYYSFKDNFKKAFSLSRIDFKYIIKNPVFWILIGLSFLFTLISAYTLGKEIYGTSTYPVTWKVLSLIGQIMGGFTAIIIYLFAGILLNLGTNYRMNLLIDATPTPNWTLLFSKFIALIKMVLLISAMSILCGIIIQIAYGFYDFNLSLYLQYYGLGLLMIIPTIALALFIQSFFRNYFVGFFVILLIQFLFGQFPNIGLELPIYDFNSGDIPSYSDMNGFGVLRTFFYYRVYWILFGVVLYGLTLLFWRRGIILGVKNRLQIFKNRTKKAVIIPMVISFVGFLALGFAFYYQYTVVDTYYSSKEEEQMRVDIEKKYKKYENYPQPRITDVKVNLELYPEERNYKAQADYIMVNKTNKAIDSLFLNYGDNLQSIEFNRENTRVLNDSVANFDIYRLNQPLQPGDTLLVTINTQNEPNTWFRDHSPIIENGTFINNSTLFPSFGYNESVELSDNDVREKYGLPNKERMADPHDMKARQNTYISDNADWINFEATVSTSKDQIAIAPGYLQKTWEENNRKYFHYKMDKKILNFYAFNSARFAVKKEKENGINYEIYYDPQHPYNLDRMMKGLKKSIVYYNENFGEYPHKQARIIEFPRTMGTFAQSFANTMPFSEGIGFIAEVDENDPESVDYPFSVVSHEMAHQWWAHQVIGANVKGSTMLSESLAEYSSLKVLEHEYGRFQMRKFLKESLDGYLRGRTTEWKEENPLIYNENQQYIHYNKGSLVMYAMSHFLGEKNFNNILKNYLQKVKYQEAPYTTSLELVENIKAGTPDSLQYLVKDMYETITLYDNKILKASSTKMKNGKYKVKVEFQVSKYRTDSEGKQVFAEGNQKPLQTTIDGEEVKSLPLNDYIEVSVFGEKTKKNNHQYDNELVTKTYKINKILNTFEIIVDEKPTEVGIDAYNMLIDRDSNDNRKAVE
ncbi:hypothetical protein KRX57_04875 [Weeksellaceae bacterium TAE3-ERU29]|nr:hypothetical protein [Weeksellaceae bacterium TAE3-ERU29]